MIFLPQADDQLGIILQLNATRSDLGAGSGTSTGSGMPLPRALSAAISASRRRMYTSRIAA
jgi:hypothetical protein